MPSIEEGSPPVTRPITFLTLSGPVKVTRPLVSTSNLLEAVEQVAAALLAEVGADLDVAAAQAHPPPERAVGRHLGTCGGQRQGDKRKQRRRTEEERWCAQVLTVAAIVQPELAESLPYGRFAMTRGRYLVGQATAASADARGAAGLRAARMASRTGRTIALDQLAAD